MSRFILLIYCLSLALMTSVVAQEPAKKQPPAKPAKPVQPAKKTEAKPGTTNQKQVIRTERSIYLPYEDLEKMFEKEGRGVFLPYREFLELWNELSIKQQKDNIKPPTDGVISSAKYTATIEGEKNKVLAIDAVIEAQSFKEEGWAVVSLAKKGLIIAEADTGDATLNLGKNGYELILPKKGKYQIKLKLFAKVLGESGTNRVSLNLPKVGVSHFTAVIPGQGWEFELKPASAYSSRNKANDTELSFFFGETDQFNVVWQKQGDETQLNSLLFVEVETKVSVVPGALQSNLKLDYQILRSGVDQFSIAVPADQEILSVEGENIKEWDVKASGDRQELSVFLHAPAKKNYTLNLALEQALGNLPAELSLPQIEALKVVRQRGSVLVTHSNELELATVKSEGLSQQSLSTDKSASQYARFRYLNLPYDLTLSVKRAEPVVEVESWTRFTVEPDQSKFHSRFEYTIKRAGIFGTQIEIPDGFEGIEVIGDVVKDFSETTTDGQRLLSVDFNNKIQGDISFIVVGRMNRDQADEDTAVPVFEPQQVSRHDGKIALSIHTSLDPRIAEAGSLRQQDVSLLSNKIPGAGGMQIGFRYRGEVDAATISYTLKKPQISSEVLTSVEVREQIVRYQWHLVYNIRYAGVDTFIVSIPESISDSLRHQGTLIKEVDKNYTEEGLVAPAGKVFWAVQLRDKKTGKYELTLTLDRPVGEDTEGESENGTSTQNFKVDLPEIQLHQVQTETGQVAVSKDDSLEILKANTTSLEVIDPKELRKQLAKAGVFLSYKYRRHPVRLNLEISRNQPLPPPQAVVTYADLTSVVSADAAITTEVIYWVQNKSRQFFSIKLPENGKIVSDFYVDGRPQQPMQRRTNDDDVILIRLPAEQNNRQFPVRFIYEVPSRHPGKKLGFGSMKAPIAELVDAEILQSRLRLYVPDGYSYRKFKSSMSMPLKERGWTKFRKRFDWIVPTLGPQFKTPENTLWQPPPGVVSNQGGFDLKVPKGGQRYTFNRLDEPSNVKIVYRSLSLQFFIEAIAALIAFVCAVLLLWRPIKWRFIYVVLAGILPLIISGVVAPTSAGFWTAIYIGTLLGVIVWLVRGLPRIIQVLIPVLASARAWVNVRLAERRKAKAIKAKWKAEVKVDKDNEDKQDA